MDLNIPSFVQDKLSARGLETIKKVKEFVETECIPAEPIYFSQISTDPAKRWASTPEITEILKTKAKKLGLWNLFLSRHYPEGPGYTNLEYGLMAQYLGRCPIAPEATNTNAPDTGNMELLARYGTPYQKKRWLKPLLDGEIRSAFLMTEKGVSSSNALNISVSAEVKGDKWVLNGVKWFASGAGDPRCDIWLVMCKTSSNKNAPYKNHTVLLVDSKRAIATGRAKVVRPLEIYGFDDAPHGHCEVVFNDLEVPVENSILADVGRGFELIQSRLGPGRIHHCMRLIGMAEQGLIQVVHRANHREIFGEKLAKKPTFLAEFAQHKIDIQKCLLLVLEAAHKIDMKDAKFAKREIAMAKIETPRTVVRILDWCVQMFGAEGVSQDTPLSKLWMHARTLRIADGPDEAHLTQLAQAEYKKFGAVDQFMETIPVNYERLAKL